MPKGYKWENRDVNELITAHPDEGCEFALSCEHCPYPTCFYDLNKRGKMLFRKNYAIQIRDTAIVRANQKGKPIGKLSIEYNLTESVIKKIVRRAK